jgi:phosphoserine phosphatase
MLTRWYPETAFVKLLILDIEGTLFRAAPRLPGAKLDSTIWQACAAALGPEAVREEIANHQRWSTGGYARSLDWARDTAEMHRKYGLTADLFHGLIAAAQYNPGVVETVLAIDRSAYVPVLISGGFRELARRAQIDLRIHHAFAACEYFFDNTGALAGYNLLPCDFAGKLDFVHLMLREYGLDERQWIFVGDGLNDVPIAKAAPVSVAYGGLPALTEVASFAITNFADLGPLLK